MVSLSIKADIAEVHEALKQLEVNIRHINKKILSGLTIAMKNRVAKNVYKHLKREDGTLKKSINRWSKSDRVGYVGSSAQMIAQVQEYGATIVPRKAARMVGSKSVKRYLWFKTKKGDWVKAREVHIPARPFFFAECEAFVNSEDFERTIDKVMQSAIKKAMK